MTQGERDRISATIRAACGLLARNESREALALLRAIRLAPVRRVADGVAGQLEMTLPLSPDAVVDGCPLGRGIRAAQCVARQVDGSKRPKDGKRGIDIDDGECSTKRCNVGRRVREALGDSAARKVKRGNKGDWAEQYERQKGKDR